MQFVHSYDEDVEYGEEVQDRDCKFAFARLLKTGKVKVLHLPVRCRDFLSDTLVWKAKETNPGKGVYGYDYTGYVDPKKVSLYFKDTRPSQLVWNVEFLRGIEEGLGLDQKTVLHIPDDLNSRELYITADKWWMQTTVHFSFYTYLLRQLSEEGIVKTWADFKPGKLGEKLPFGVLERIPELLKKMQVNGVCGTAPQYRSDRYVVHDYNGFKSQFTHPDSTNYGAQLNGLLKT